MNSHFLKLQNLWWDDPKAIDSDQHILNIKDKPYRYDPPIVKGILLEPGDLHILRGPRQVGKTTILKLLIERLLKERNDPSSIIYLSCESIDSFKELLSILTEFLEKKKSSRTYLFLDEISFVSEWQRAILSLWNAGLLKSAMTVLTGSNARDLKKSSERLPGRRGKGKDHAIYPLSILEMQRLKCFQGKGLEQILDVYLSVGGFPIAIRDYVEFGNVSDVTYETYRNWIVGDASRFELRQETLKQILFRIYKTTASRITWPKLIENSPVRSHETALEYVEHLQDAFLCKVHHCYDENTKGASLTKSRKIFFIDPLLYAIAGTWRDGILNIHEWMDLQLRDRDLKGRIFESVAINHLARMHDRSYFWYSSKTKKEVDIVIPQDKDLLLYEVKVGQAKPYKALGKEVTILDPASFLKLIEAGLHIGAY